jgi:hypothetical protein
MAAGALPAKVGAGFAIRKRSSNLNLDHDQVRRAPRVAAMPGGHGDLIIPSRCVFPRSSKVV